MQIETCSTPDRGYMGDRARGAGMGRASRSRGGRATVLRSEIALHERIRAQWAADTRYPPSDSDMADIAGRIAAWRAELAAIEQAADIAPCFHLRRVRLNSGGYDSGGALYEAFTDDGAEFMTLRVMAGDRTAAFERRTALPRGNPEREHFERSSWSDIGTREAAKDLVRAEYPDARFYR